jgi:hypothetical protein
MDRPDRRAFWALSIQLGAAIAAVRVPLVWVSAFCFQQSGPGQSVGYYLLMTNSIIEVYLARSWRHEAWWIWATILSGLVAASSIVLGFLVASVARIPRRFPPRRSRS